MTAPGWYPDPSGKPGQIYWDGNAWTQPPASPPPKKSILRNKWIIAAGVLVVLGLIGNAGNHDKGTSSTASSITSSTRAAKSAPSEPASSGCGDSGPTCDAVPAVDGIYKVNDGGMLSVGISTGWIETSGPRAGSTHCAWSRLSGPKNTIDMTIQAGMAHDTAEGPVDVDVQSSDYAFFSDGCAPWHSI